MSRFGVFCVSLVLAATASVCAQQPEGATPAPPAPPPPAQPQQAVSQEPYILEDGGFSIEPFYWFTTFLPNLPVVKGGAASNYTNADYNYPGINKDSPGATIGVPAGRQSTIRLSYFRMLGRGSNTISNDLTLLGTTPFAAGDYLSTNFNLQVVKASWDFYTYPLPPGPRKVRLKTLWEVQWLTFHTSITAPYAPVTTDSSGNAISNYAYESKNLILPTLGAELEQAPFKHFRYELKATGFGLPHHGDIWDAEGSMGFRYGHVELMIGAKAFHFKTSPKGDDYFAETLSGPYAGIRYYLGREQ